MTRRTLNALSGSFNRNWLVAAGLLVPLAVLYRRLLFENQTWQDFDFLLSYGPRYELLQSGLKSGSIPLWTDAYLGGFPIAFSEFGWFYPVTWLFLTLLPMPLAYHAETAFGLLLAAASAYWLARIWGLDRSAAFLAAYLFAFGPFVFATSRFLNYADIFFVLPAGLAATEKIARGRFIFVPALAVIVAVAILAGHPQIALMLVSAIGAYGVFRAVQLYRERGGRASLKYAGLLALVLALALASGAPRLLPVLAVTAESTRASGLDFGTASGGSASPWSLLLGYIYPSFEIPRILDGQLRAEPLAYTGLLAIPLITLAIWTRRREPTVIFLAGLAVVAWVLALGSFTPVFEILHRLPLWGFVRQPGRFIVLVAFAFAFLSGFGLQVLRKESARRLRLTRAISRLLVGYAALILAATVLTTILLSAAAGPIRDIANRAIDRFVVGGPGRFGSAEQYYATFDLLFKNLQKSFTLASWTPAFTLAAAILSALVIWGYVRGKISPRAAVGAVTLVLAADVFFSLGHGIDAIPARYFEAPTATAHSSVIPPDSRVFSYRGLADKWELSVGTGDRLNQTQRDQIEYLFLRQVLTPNLPMRSGLSSIDGYENLMSRRQAEILSYLGSERTTLSGFASDPISPEEEKARILGDRMPVFAALGVDAVFSGTSVDASLGESRVSIDVEFPEWAGVDQTVWIYGVPATLGRAYLTELWQPDDSTLPTSSILDSLAESPPGSVFVDGDPGFPSSDAEPAGRILSSHSSDGTRTYRVDVDRTALFVSNSFVTRGWKAEVDGRQSPYLTVNRFAAAVTLEPGEYVVRFAYSPPDWAVARGLGIAGGISITVLAVIAVVREIGVRRRAVPSGPATND